MKTNLLKYYIAAFYLCSTFVLVAQPGSGNGENGDAGLEGTDAPAAPIDVYIWVLAAIGLIYVFLRGRAFAQQQKTPQE
jgi:hypothetical protein